MLLHSLGTDGGLWEAQVSALEADGYEVLTPDSAGHGKNRRRVPAELADWVRELGDVVPAGESRVHLVGLSMEGVRALAYAVANPGRAPSLVLANTFAQLAP